MTPEENFIIVNGEIQLRRSRTLVEIQMTPQPNQTPEESNIGRNPNDPITQPDSGGVADW